MPRQLGVCTYGRSRRLLLLKEDGEVRVSSCPTRVASRTRDSSGGLLRHGYSRPGPGNGETALEKQNWRRCGAAAVASGALLRASSGLAKRGESESLRWGPFDPALSGEARCQSSRARLRLRPAASKQMLGRFDPKGDASVPGEDDVDSYRGRAHAVVVKISEFHGESDAPGDGAGGWTLGLRVPLDDGSRIDVSRTATRAEVGDLLSVGDVVPIRFDSGDFSNVEIDLPCLQEHFDESTYTPLGSWHPIERLRRLNDLHDHGLLSDEEFDEARSEPLSEA